MSLILNFLTEISIIEGKPQTLPQRIDDVEAEGCLNVTAIICPICALHFNMQIRDMSST
jgi:hypothetical protein